MCENMIERKRNILESVSSLDDYLNHTEFHCISLTSCLPISRKDRLLDLVQSGEIDKIWLIPGHVFVLCNGGKQLLTFDCKPAHLQQYEDSIFLDLLDINTEIVDIFVYKPYPKTVLILFKNGTLQLWKYSEAGNWSGVLQVNILHSKHSEVISFCVHEDHGAIYWCEVNEGVYSVCRRSLPHDLEELEQTSIGNIESILSHCLPSDIFPNRDFLYVVPRHSKEQVQSIIIWRPSTDHIIVFIGEQKTKIDISWTNQNIDFRNVLLKCLPLISKATVPFCKYVSIYDSVSEELVLVHNDGKVNIIHIKQEEVGSVGMVTLQLQNTHNLDIHVDNCFISNGFLSILTKDLIRIYSLHTGQFLKEIQSPDKTGIVTLVKCLNPIFIGGFLGKSNICLIQKTICKDELVKNLSDCSNFQTNALKYAQLSQERMNGKECQEKLNELKQSWEYTKSNQASSHLSQIIEPYINEFWNLEEFSQHAKPECFEEPSSSLASIPVEDIEEEINNIISGCSTSSLSWQQSQLLILTEKYPKQVLDILSENLNLNEESISESEMIKWRRILGLGEQDAINYQTYIFHLLCRLIFKLQPSLLVKFVEKAQVVSEKYIGVSAFVRKRHSMQYYQKALDCLPEPRISISPTTAIISTSQLILASGDKQSVLKAVRYLVSYQQWAEVFHLLKHEDITMNERSMMLYILVTALAKAGNLKEYKDEISSIVPHWQQCCHIESIIEVMGEEKNGNQETRNKNRTVFLEDQPAIASIQPLLQDLFEDISL